MTADEPDIARLFAPVDITAAVRGVLAEADAALGGIDDPVDAELWGSDVIGALTAAAKTAGAKDAVDEAVTGTLIPAAEQAATPVALAVLRIFAVLGSPQSRAAAVAAAGRVAKLGVADAGWAAGLGSPAVLDCWHYADVGGRQESLTLTFGYGDRQHALSVLIDHGRGSTIKDVWVTKGAGQLLSAELAAGSDPLVVFDLLLPAQARETLARAVAAGESPEQPDQHDDITAHRALLHSRLAYLS